MNRFTPNPHQNHSERKAVLVALIVSLFFISFVAVANWSRTHRRPRPSFQPVTLQTGYPPSEFSPVPYTAVPDNFSDIDFYNRSYGNYFFTTGSVHDLKLKNGGYQMAADFLNWFELKQVYYVDLNGDDEPEAIARISHIKCKRACDGGADLFFVYSNHRGKLQKLWQYETGSYENGCGLKSFLVTGRQLLVEEFGYCPNGAPEANVKTRFMASTQSLSLFDMNRGEFVRRSIDFFPIEPQNLVSYEPEIKIDQRSYRARL